MLEGSKDFFLPGFEVSLQGLEFKVNVQSFNLTQMLAKDKY